MSQAEDDLEDSAAPLVEHLAELRTRLIRSVIAFILGIVVMFVFAEPAYQFILEPLRAILEELNMPTQIVYNAPQEYFFVLVRISIIMGFAVSFPVIAHQLWSFVAPGLYRTEKNAFLPFIFASPFLFLLGASFAHFVVTPLAMRFFIGFADAIPAMAAFLTGQDYTPSEASTELQTTFLGTARDSLDLSLKFIFAFGICFQLPVVLTLMGKAGLVSSEGLGNVRKWAVVAILTLAALVTPPDVITQVILFVVVYGLYEISIQLVRWVEHARNKRLRAEGILDEDEEF